MRATSVEIRSASPTQIDGEFFGHAPATVEIVPDALTLRIPPDYK